MKTPPKNYPNAYHICGAWYNCVHTMMAKKKKRWLANRSFIGTFWGHINVVWSRNEYFWLDSVMSKYKP